LANPSAKFEISTFDPFGDMEYPKMQTVGHVTTFRTPWTQLCILVSASCD